MSKVNKICMGIVVATVMIAIFMVVRGHLIYNFNYQQWKQGKTWVLIENLPSKYRDSILNQIK